MKLETKRGRTMLGRPANYYTCELTETGWTATGPTKEQAQENLCRKLRLQEENSGAVHYLRAWDSTWVLSYRHGWGYDIVRDDKPNSCGSCLLSCQTRTEALEQMKRHFEQYQADHAVMA